MEYAKLLKSVYVERAFGALANLATANSWVLVLKHSPFMSIPNCLGWNNPTPLACNLVCLHLLVNAVTSRYSSIAWYSNQLASIVNRSEAGSIPNMLYLKGFRKYYEGRSWPCLTCVDSHGFTLCRQRPLTQNHDLMQDDSERWAEQVLNEAGHTSTQASSSIQDTMTQSYICLICLASLWCPVLARCKNLRCQRWSGSHVVAADCILLTCLVCKLFTVCEYV